MANRALVGRIGAGHLLAPSGIAADPARAEVLVSDYGAELNNASVRIFSYASGTFGAPVGQISGAGDCSWFSCQGGFSRPLGPAVRNSRVYVPDVMYAQVLVFDRDTGEQVFALGSGERSLSDLRVPSDVTITDAGDVFVTSSMTKEVVRFLGGAP